MLHLRTAFPSPRAIDLFLAGAMAANERGSLLLKRSQGRHKRGNPPVYRLVRVDPATGESTAIIATVRAWNDAAAVDAANALLSERRATWLDNQRKALRIASMSNLAHTAQYRGIRMEVL